VVRGRSRTPLRSDLPSRPPSSRPSSLPPIRDVVRELEFGKSPCGMNLGQLVRAAEHSDSLLQRVVRSQAQVLLRLRTSEKSLELRADADRDMSIKMSKNMAEIVKETVAKLMVHTDNQMKSMLTFLLDHMTDYIKDSFQQLQSAIDDMRSRDWQSFITWGPASTCTPRWSRGLVMQEVCMIIFGLDGPAWHVLRKRIYGTGICVCSHPRFRERVRAIADTTDLSLNSLVSTVTGGWHRPKSWGAVGAALDLPAEGSDAASDDDAVPRRSAQCMLPLPVAPAGKGLEVDDLSLEELLDDDDDDY